MFLGEERMPGQGPRKRSRPIAVLLTHPDGTTAPKPHADQQIWNATVVIGIEPESAQNN
jgi:hypothetical protein